VRAASRPSHLAECFGLPGCEWEVMHGPQHHTAVVERSQSVLKQGFEASSFVLTASSFLRNQRTRPV
jgi:hypothetical protein